MSKHLLPPGKLPHDLLARLVQRYAPGNDPRLLVPPGVGEDAAVIDFGDRCLVVKTDPITFATDAVGWYAVHVNANDIAAMGARPTFFLATILVPAHTATEELIESIFASIHAAADELGVTVCGGHTEITPGIDRPLVVGQMLGEVDRDDVVRSSGLVPGDVVLLTKGMAIEATAIIARERRADLVARGYDALMLERCCDYLTNPGISVVADARIALQAGQVHAMHDPTEGGVATGLFELAEASDVGLDVDGDALPISADSKQLCQEFDLDPLGVISSGALLIGCPAESAEAISSALEEAGVLSACIAHVKERAHGLRFEYGGDIRPLPRFAVDEITKLFG
jgi:hydrogenase maturation factor